MKGKQLFNKIFSPSVVFFSGILLIVTIFVFFAVLHISSLSAFESLNDELNHINNQVFEIMSQDNIDKKRCEELIIRIKQLIDSEAFLVLSPTFTNYNAEDMKKVVQNKEDLYSVYKFIDEIEKNIHEYNIQREKSFRILYVLISITIIILVLFLGVSQYESHKVLQNERVYNSINSKLYDQLEKERSLIAFELHDDIAQKLAIIKRYFNSKNSIDDHTVLMENYSVEVIKRVRYLSRMLKAPDNPNVSFKDYLETLFSDFNVLSEYRLNRKIIGINALKLTPSAALHIYRIIQEILTNSRIHSEATEINLLLVYSHPTLNIKYSDNGKGFDPYLVYKKGIGLDSIKYRLDILRGKYVLNSKEGEGTDISIDIPIELCEIS
ncbi:MAG: hypothetical protein PF518_07330 [Spirochaetaceae bacterium]|jgi:signal transduction histidine kinase|nr:hypothetical protein [Spirochaetaceae bacterium]